MRSYLIRVFWRNQQASQYEISNLTDSDLLLKALNGHKDVQTVELLEVSVTKKLTNITNPSKPVAL